MLYNLNYNRDQYEVGTVYLVAKLLHNPYKLEHWRVV